MPKQKPQKSSPKYRLSTRKVLLYIVLPVGVLLVIAQVVINFVLLNRVVIEDDPSIVTELIISAAEDANKPVPLEAASGKAYFPEARLVLPATNDMQLKYRFDPASNDQQPVLFVTSGFAMRQAQAKLWSAQANGINDIISTGQKTDAMFKQVPNLQACTRGVHVYFNDKTNSDGAEIVLAGTKLLNDGRTLHIYTDNGCSGGNLMDIATYLKQSESY